MTDITSQQQGHKQQERHGHCLCGAVRITAKDASTDVGACHCSMCRRWGGGPFMEINCGNTVEIQGEDHIAVYDSSDWAERGFCRTCGTHLFYRLKDTQEHMIPVGLFEEDAGLTLALQVFIDQKPPYYGFDKKTAVMTAAEIFAMFGGGES